MGVIAYLKRLFIEREKPLSRRDFGGGIGLLWFMNAFQARGVMLAIGSTMAIGRFFGTTQLAAFSMLSSASGLMLIAGIPWSAGLLVASVLAVRRAFRTNLALGILGGIPVFALFRSFAGLPGIASAISGGMTPSSEMLALVKPAALFMAAAVIALALIGLGIVIMALASAESAESPLDPPEASKPGRCRFLVYSTVIGILAAAFAALAAVAGIGEMLDFESARAVAIAAASVAGMLLLIGFIIGVMRMLESGTSLLWLLPPFISGAIGSALIAFSIAVKNIWMFSAGGYVIGLSLDAQAALFIALVLRPSRVPSGDEDAKLSTPASGADEGSPGAVP